MSLTQSRSSDNKYDPHFGKPGSASSSNASGGPNRGFSGDRGRGCGRGRGGNRSNSSHYAPHNSTNSSYKKVNNAQVGQPRSNPNVNASHFNTTTGARSVQNGDHVHTAVQGVSSAPTPDVVTKPTNQPPRKTSQPLPRAPSSSTNSDSTLPSTPAKGGGAKGIPLQFGSISPGLINGLQVPARTSSAPPNLDEQPRDQARLNALRSVPPEVPSSIGSKQELLKKDVALIKNPVTQENKSELLAKRDIKVASASPSPPTQGQKPPALPTAGISTPYSLPQPTTSMPFGWPTPQIQSQGVPTFPLQMPHQMGNPSQVQHQFSVPGLQHPLLQTPPIMHPGLNMGYNPNLATQPPPNMRNIGNNKSTQYDQQPSGKFSSPHKSVKITHPDTHEELRLEAKDGGPSGSKSHYSGPTHNHHLPTFTANQPMGYYPNSYITNPSFYPVPSSHPLTSEQLNGTTQSPMFNHQTQSNISIKNLPSKTLPVKTKVKKHGNVDSSSAGYIRNSSNTVPQVPPRSTAVTIKAAGDKATSIHGLGNAKPPKLVDPSLEPGVCKRDVEVILQSESGVGCLNQSTSVVSSISAPSPAALSTFPRNANSEVTGGRSISIGDSQTSSKKADGKSDSKILKDLVDSSESAKSDMSEDKTAPTSSGLKDNVAETITSSHTASDSAPTDASVHPSCSSESCQSQINEADTQSGLPECKDISKESAVTKDGGEQECQEVLPSGNSPKDSDAQNGANLIDQVKLTENADLASCEVEASKRDADLASSVTKGESTLHDVSDNSITSSDSLDCPSFKDLNVTESDIPDNVVTSVSANILEPDALDEPKVIDNPRPSSSSSSISGELNKTKHKGKKRLKELLQKADALESTDLYLAYKGPQDKKESSVASEHAAEENINEVSEDANIEKSTCEIKDEQDQVELDDWEDAADDIPIPKFQLFDKVDHNEEVSTKKYSRDFLLTFSKNCIDLPAGFDITSDVGDALMSVSISVRAPPSDREYPSPRTGVDRPSDWRGNRAMDTDRRYKQPGPFPLSQDPRGLPYGTNILGPQGVWGPTNGVLRNPHSHVPAQHGGGSSHSVNFQGLQRNTSNNDLLERGSQFKRGLKPPPHIPAPVIHKAENKYEVGKTTDEEQAKQRKLKGILNKLTPQNFERLFQQVKEVNIDNVVTLTGVISQIFYKALIELTFCEMYATFCQHLASELPDLSVDNEKITFRRLLLNKCQEEFEKGEREEQEADNVDGEGDSQQSEAVREEKKVKARRRMLGNIRLIGELYKKRMLTERIMHECIKKLLGQHQNPHEENIEALCKLMSTIGEMIDHQKAKEHMDAYFDIMRQLSNNMELSSRVRFMLKDAIDLRKNKWQERRKIEGPKKIEDVHRDAAQERLGQVSRLNHAPSMNSSMRRAQPPLDFGTRGSMLSSPIDPGMSLRGFNQFHGFGGQEMRMDTRNISMPYPQRLSSEVPVTFGPQGGLARGMSFRGQPSVSNSPMFDRSQSFEDPSGRVGGGLNGYSPAHNTREDHFARNASNRPGASAAFGQSSKQEVHPGYTRVPDRNLGSSRLTTPLLPMAGPSVPQNNSSDNTGLEKQLRDKTLDAIKEYYSAKDEKEVALCIKDLNSPNFNSDVVSIWVSDSFERKDADRNSLAKLLVTLTKSHDATFSPPQLIQGFRSVLTELEDTVTDAFKAPEFLGKILAKIVLENVLPLSDVTQLIKEGGEQPGLAAQVIGSLYEMIRSEKGESILQLDDFRPIK